MITPKVLIVEDDEWLAQEFAKFLEKDGFDTKVSFHVISAVKMIDEFKPDVMILDLLLTGSTAFTLMHELQTYDDTKNLPIILCTNLANEIDFDSLKPYGVRRLIDKTTMHPSDLSAAIRSVLL